MSRRRAQVLPDVDDNAVAAPPPPAGAHDVDHMIRLLEWGRAKGYAIGPTVQIGSVTIQVKDLRVAKREALRSDENKSSDDIYSEHGLGDDHAPADGTTG